MRCPHCATTEILKRAIIILSAIYFNIVLQIFENIKKQGQNFRSSSISRRQSALLPTHTQLLRKLERHPCIWKPSSCFQARQLMCPDSSILWGGKLIRSQSCFVFSYILHWLQKEMVSLKKIGQKGVFLMTEIVIRPQKTQTLSQPETRDATSSGFYEKITESTLSPNFWADM